MVTTNIIANLGGTLTSDIIAQLQAPDLISAFMSGLIVLLLTIVLVILIAKIMKSAEPSKSKEYRSLLTDMYVVGMVKKSAKEEDVDLMKELKEFNKLQKKKFICEQDIDSVIEDNLKEKINAKAEKLTEQEEEK